MRKFPDNFLWGTAVAAHQVEGNNTNTDWWEYEMKAETERQSRARAQTAHEQNAPNSPNDTPQAQNDNKPIYPLEPSGIACDSYNRYEEDFDLCVKLNNNAVRISVEWARIEPTQGTFDQEQIEHYKRVLTAAKQRNLKTFVTLHHFTIPIWLARQGGWRGLRTPQLFANYAKKCAEEFGELIDVYLTINEPQVYAMMAHLIALWPPAQRNPFKSLETQIGFIRGHNKAYKAIKTVNPNYQVGIVKNLTWFEPDPFDIKWHDTLVAKILNFAARDFFLTPVRRNLDLLGINYYFTNRIKNLRTNNPGDYVSDLGWWINPGGLEGILKECKAFGIPMYVTENGLADSQDRFRKKFIHDHLAACHNAISDGADVRGYFHWSLIDNYEWHQGFWPRFGLVEIDRENGLERKPRESFYYYADIAKTNEVS